MDCFAWELHGLHVTFGGHVLFPCVDCMPQDEKDSAEQRKRKRKTERKRKRKAGGTIGEKKRKKKKVSRQH